MFRRTVTRLSRWLLAIIVVAAAAGLAWQWNRSRLDLAATPPPGQFVDVGGHRLHLWCIGSGPPTVVFESGLGGGAFDWGYVQPSVARSRRACTYDRAGYGYSELGPRPRSSRQIANELFTLLDRAGSLDQSSLSGTRLAATTCVYLPRNIPARSSDWCWSMHRTRTKVVATPRLDTQRRPPIVRAVRSAHRRRSGSYPAHGIQHRPEHAGTRARCSTLRRGHEVPHAGTPYRCRGVIWRCRKALRKCAPHVAA